MSIQSDAKKSQGFIKSSANCDNCKNFTFKKETYQTKWSTQEFTKESELRCIIGKFKVSKSNWCKLHDFII